MQPNHLICFGDSITQGEGIPDALKWPSLVSAKFDEVQPGRFKVHNKGVGGNTTALALDRIQSDVLPFLPGVVLIEFAINDAYVYPWCGIARLSESEFRRNLEEIIRIIRSANGIPVLLKVHEVTSSKDLHKQGNGRAIAENLGPYVSAIDELSQNGSIPLIDIPFEAQRRQVAPELLLSEDGVHLSEQGNSVYAQACVERLLEILDR